MVKGKESKGGKVPEKKIKEVDELVELIQKSRSIVIVGIKNLPTRQFQLIKKKLKDKAVVKVVKKIIANRAIDKIEKGAIKNLKKQLKEDTALIFSELDPFELSAILSKNKTYARAKTGQRVEEEVAIESGLTELVPGPIISELGSLGIQFSVEDGKISIRERKVILKPGEKVNEAQVSLMGKLDMKPIAVGLEPVIAYDSKEDKIYEDIKIDAEETIKKLKESGRKAMGLAVKICYICKESLSFLLRKASSEEKVLSNRIKYEKEGIKTTPEEIEEAKKAIGEGEREKENAQQEENKSKEEK